MSPGGATASRHGGSEWSRPSQPPGTRTRTCGLRVLKCEPRRHSFTLIVACRFSSFLSFGALLSWSFAGFLTDPSPSVSHRSVIFLTGQDAGAAVIRLLTIIQARPQPSRRVTAHLTPRSRGTADRRTLARASAHLRAGSNAEQPALVTRWPAADTGTCSLCRSAAVRLGLSGAGSRSDRRLGPSLSSGLRGARTFAAALPKPMYRITCPSRTRLHARSQVLARHRCLMYRVIGHYPVGNPEIEQQLD